MSNMLFIKSVRRVSGTLVPAVALSMLAASGASSASDTSDSRLPTNSGEFTASTSWGLTAPEDRRLTASIGWELTTPEDRRLTASIGWGLTAPEGRRLTATIGWELKASGGDLKAQGWEVADQGIGREPVASMGRELSA